MATPAKLAEFMAAQSAFVAQKCTIDYCQARSGLMWPKLEKEKSFRDALDHARWEAYPMVLSDVGVIDRGTGAPGAQPVRCAAVRELARADLCGLPQPLWAAAGIAASAPHGTRMSEQFRRRLGQVQMAAPRPVHEVGGEFGRRPASPYADRIPA